MRYESSIGALLSQAAEAPRRLLVVRITHWIAVVSILALLASGIGILISHPRLYWGEVGTEGEQPLRQFRASLPSRHDGFGDRSQVRARLERLAQQFGVADHDREEVVEGPD